MREATCAQLSCVAKKFKCVLDEIRKVYGDPACAASLAPYFTSTTSECAREVCSVPMCSPTQYTNACEGITTTAKASGGDIQSTVEIVVFVIGFVLLIL